MEFNLSLSPFNNQQTDCLVVTIYENNRLSTTAEQLDQQSNGYLRQILANGDITGKIGQCLLLQTIPNVQAKRILLLGCGKEPLTERQYQQVISKMVQTLKETKSTNVYLDFTDVSLKDRSNYWAIRFAIETIAEQSYVYDDFKSKKSPVNSALQTITFAVLPEQQSLAQQAVKEGKAIVTGVQQAKNVANCPPNVCNPHYLSQLATQLAEDYATITTTIVNEKAMTELGMQSYLAVSRGSANEAFMSVIEYRNHPNSNAKPIVLVGKGMTFDSGGLSLKPAEAMDEMKYDMCGAASVYGTMKAIAELNLPLNVIGIMAGCENMPDGNTYRPGDIITTMSGLTVEVLNTDAEGRMVLCDVLTYVERFNPELVIDIATLTGACVVALGHHTTGLLSTNENVAQDLLAAAQLADDRTWRLPLGEEYQEMLKSNFADLAHIGGRYGGAITAGQFLSNFTQHYTWAHLDIAGTAWKSGANKGATGRPVPLLTQFLLNKVK